MSVSPNSVSVSHFNWTASTSSKLWAGKSDLIQFDHVYVILLRWLSVENQHYTHRRLWITLFLLFNWTKFHLFYRCALVGLHYSISGRVGSQSETLRCPRAHLPNSRIINWKSRGNVIQFFNSLNRLHISSSQEAQRLGHFKAQPCALVRQLARRRISYSFAANGGVCIVRAWNRLIKSIEAAWCGLNASLPDTVGL